MGGNNLKSTTELFQQHLLSQDKTVTLVLKAHLIIESIIDKILDITFPVKENLIKSKRFNFNQKVELCYSLNGFNEQAYQIVKAVNRIRNVSAHELKPYLTIADFSPLASALGKDLSQAASAGINDIESEDYIRTVYASLILSSALGVLSAWLDIGEQNTNSQYSADC